MSIELTLEKPDSTEEPIVRYTKRIDDLIEDAEIEAEIEAEQKIRAKNTRTVTISTVAVGVLVFLYLSTQNPTEPPPAKEMMEQASASLSVPAGSMPDTPPEPISGPQDQAEPLQPTPVSGTTLEEVAFPLQASEKSGSVTTSTMKTPDKQPPVENNPPPNTIRNTLGLAATPPVREDAILTPLKSSPALKATGKPLPKPTPAVTAPGKYFVQVGAFSKRGNADRLTENLKSKGFKPVTLSKTVGLSGGKKTMHVVRVGNYPSPGKAKQAQSRLEQVGYQKTFISRAKTG